MATRDHVTIVLSLLSRPTDPAWKVFWPEQHNVKLVWPYCIVYFYSPMTTRKVYTSSQSCTCSYKTIIFGVCHFKVSFLKSLASENNGILHQAAFSCSYDGTCTCTFCSHYTCTRRYQHWCWAPLDVARPGPSWSVWSCLDSMLQRRARFSCVPTPTVPLTFTWKLYTRSGKVGQCSCFIIHVHVSACSFMYLRPYKVK